MVNPRDIAGERRKKERKEMTKTLTLNMRHKLSKQMHLCAQCYKAQLTVGGNGHKCYVPETTSL